MNKTHQQSLDVRINPRIEYPYLLQQPVVIKTGIKNHAFNVPYINMDNEGKLSIDVGYAWDGASGAINTANWILASLAHDALYQALRLNCLPIKYRKTADKLLMVICQVNGMSWLRAHYSYLAVRAIGWRFTKYLP